MPGAIADGPGALGASFLSASLSALRVQVAAHIRADADLEQRSINPIGSAICTVAIAIRGYSQNEFRELAILIGRILGHGPNAPLDEPMLQRLLTMAPAHPIPSFVSQER